MDKRDMPLDVSAVSISIETTRIVEDIHLRVEPGEIVGLIGPNGSGKSTLLRSVYRMLKPEAGYIRLGDEDVWKMNARESARRTGVVVQESASDFEFTVSDVVMMGRTPHKGLLELDNAQDEDIIASALKQVDMSAFAQRLYGTLSGGEKQRVLMARALAQQPKLLVLDEHTNHLDIRHQLEVLDLVQKLGLTTLITLHDLNLAAIYCHRLYMLKAGHIVASGSPVEVLTPHNLRDVFEVEAFIGKHPTRGHLQLSFCAIESLTEKK
jgi:iron complex transport system ATP-binding protein